MSETLKIFDQDVEFKCNMCSHKKGEIITCPMALNLYIKVGDACNANCKFCSNQGCNSFSKIDLEKLKYVISYLNSRNLIYRISITGGEPFLNPVKLNEIINSIYEVMPDAHVTINTNGTNLENLLYFDNVDKLDSVHISRHHYEDDINDSIFGMKTISSEVIADINSKSKKNLIRLNGMLMRDYINSLEEVKKYLEYTSSLGISKVGFVSLMKVNDYAKEQFIDFNEIFKNLDDKFMITDRKYDLDVCECLNGVYIADNGLFLDFYARMTKDLEVPYARGLVYTPDNHLQSGFNNKIIY